VTIFDPIGLSALGSGVIAARYIFAHIEKRNVRISDPAASMRLPSRVDLERLLFMLFGTEWILLALFIFADRLPTELERFVRLASASSAFSLILFHLICVARLRRLGIFHEQDETYRPAGIHRAKRPRPRRRAPE
jgi:hypothetical protein